MKKGNLYFSGVLAIGVLFAVIFAFSNVSSDITGYAIYNGFSDPIDNFLINQEIEFSDAVQTADMNIEISDDLVFFRGYISKDGNDWEMFEFEGTPSSKNRWLTGVATKTLTLNANEFDFTTNPNPDNYVIALIS